MVGRTGENFGVEKRWKKKIRAGRMGFSFIRKTASTGSSATGALVAANSLQPDETVPRGQFTFLVFFFFLLLLFFPARFFSLAHFFFLGTIFFSLFFWETPTYPNPPTATNPPTSLILLTPSPPTSFCVHFHQKSFQPRESLSSSKL